MIDWRTAKIASSGDRGMRLRLRHATTSPSVNAAERRRGAGGGRVLRCCHAIFSSASAVVVSSPRA